MEGLSVQTVANDRMYQSLSLKFRRILWSCIKYKRTRHLTSMDQGRVVKKISESKPEGRKRMVRPRLRWLEDAEKNLWDKKVKRWRQKAVDREEWSSAMKESKACRRPYSQGVSR